ncbi:MAG: hypothetical protein HPY44_16705 [Armatimonadetes bacterium]|nr:hypothetical protein [Armatimonadota bacterium]
MRLSRVKPYHVLFVTLLAIVVSGGGYAADDWPPYVSINGEVTEMPTSAPILTAGEILVPLEDLVAALDGQMARTGDRQYKVERGDSVIELTVDQAAFKVNGQTETFTIFPVLVGGVLYVDARDMVTALGGDFAWNAAKLTAELTIEPPNLVRQIVQGSLVYVDKRQTPPFFLVSTPQGTTSVLYAAPQIKYFVSAPSGSPVPASLDAFQVQDSVELGLDRSNQVVQATLVREYLTAKVEYVVPGILVASVNGQRKAYNIPEDAELLSDEGKPIAQSAVKQGQAVALLLDREGKNIRQLVVQTPATAGRPRITLVQVEGISGPVRKRESVNVTLQGTPGGTATFDIGHAVQGVPMTEGPAGTYKGSYRVEDNLLTVAQRVRGNLVVNGVSAPSVLSKQMVTIDTDTPRFVDMSPAKGARLARGPIQITVGYTDRKGPGVDPTRVTLKLDAKDVTNQAIVTDSQLTYTGPELAPGAHKYEVTIVDYADNSRTETVDFTVLASTAAIVAVTHNATGPLAPGDTLTVVLEAAAPGRSAYFIIGANWRRVNMERQANTSIYTGQYVVTADDRIDAAPVVGYLIDQAGRTHQLQAEKTVTITTALPTQLRIVSPAEGYRHVNLDEKLVVSGRAAPGSRVRVTVRYSYFLSTKDLHRDTVTANNMGQWQTREFNLKLGGIKGMLVSEYEIIAEVLDAQDRVVETATVKVPLGEETAEE